MSSKTKISYRRVGGLFNSEPHHTARRSNNYSRQVGYALQGLSYQSQEIVFSTLLAEGKLYQHCAEIEKQANEMYDPLIE